MTEFRPFFIEGSAGRLFSLLQAPEGAAHCVLIVPPFAEEMNKSRRQIRITAQELVNNGIAVLSVDLFGTGDSEGNFEESSWRQWRSDLATALEWMRSQRYATVSIVAIRLGCPLALAALRDSGSAVERVVFWQPVTNGQNFVRQFLRLRVAADLMTSGTTENVANLEQRLADGEQLTVAGYELSAALWSELKEVRLTNDLQKNMASLAVFEISRMGDQVSPALQKFLGQPENLDIDVSAERITADPFWSSTEILVNDELARKTAAILAEPAS